MATVLTRLKFARLASLVEVLVVLALGNIAGVLLFNAIVPAAVTQGDVGGIAAALYAGLRILLRIGLVAVFGLALLWYRRGLTPRDAGLTRAGKPVAHLVGIGIVLGAFSSLLVALVFAAHELMPLGEGLPAWAAFRESAWTTALLIELLATSVLIPPITEEIMARGYMRVRLVESYGHMNGVVLTGLVFALIHGKFLSLDPLILISLAMFVVSSIAWTYVAHATGSLIPPMIAHALTNITATAVLINVWVPLVVAVTLVVWQRQPILAMLRRFSQDWRANAHRSQLVFAIVVLVSIIAVALLVMTTVGRMAGLIALGLLGLVLTVMNIAREKRS